MHVRLGTFPKLWETMRCKAGKFLNARAAAQGWANAYEAETRQRRLETGFARLATVEFIRLCDIDEDFLRPDAFRFAEGLCIAVLSIFSVLPDTPLSVIIFLSIDLWQSE